MTIDEIHRALDASTLDYDVTDEIMELIGHNGCNDCKYETYPDSYYPCCDCKQNYVDKWQMKEGD